METTPFERLRIYKETLEFIKQVYLLCKTFPKDEIYALIDQLKMSATSILINIAEGQGRLTAKDKAHFLYTARGSIYEVLAILDIAFSQNYLTQHQLEDLRNDLFHILKQLNSLISYYLK